MSNKTKEEIEQIGSEYYNSCSYIHLGFIHGYTQCQETLTARILELESQIESLTNLAVMEVSCKCDDCEYFNNILTPKTPNKIKWILISEINTLKNFDIVCFIQLYKDRIIQSDTNNFKWFKDHRDYDIRNSYTHFIKLPNP